MNALGDLTALQPTTGGAGRADHRTAGLLTGASLLYATVRYNLFKGVPWADWPAYTVNKALAVGSLLIVLVGVIRLCRSDGRSGVLLGWAGALALAHSLLSFALLDPTYYPRLFEAGKLTAPAGLSLTIGVLATAGMELGARRAGSWPRPLRHGTLALIAFCGGLHAALPATSTWLAPASWPGGLPPLTLISFLAGALAVTLWLSHVRAQRGWK